MDHTGAAARVARLLALSLAVLIAIAVGPANASTDRHPEDVPVQVSLSLPPNPDHARVSASDDDWHPAPADAQTLAPVQHHPNFKARSRRMRPHLLGLCVNMQAGPSSASIDSLIGPHSTGVQAAFKHVGSFDASSVHAISDRAPPYSLA